MSTQTTEPTKALVPFGKQGVTLTSMEDAFRFAVAVSKSGFAPKGIETPEAILIAVQFGAELGLTPMSSLQSLAIINGRPAVYGDAALALVRGSGELESYQQSTTGEGENMKAVVRVKRKGEAEIVSEFSVADAKKAQLWGKAGPWSQYAARMLMWRARGFALRDAFGDVLRGLRTVEEAQDIPADTAIALAKPVFLKKEKAVKEATAAIADAESLPPEKAASASQESPDKPKAAESATAATGGAPASEMTPADKLSVMISEAGLKFADMVPVLHGSRLCGREAKSVDDLSDKNCLAIIEDFADIVEACRKDTAP